MPFRVLQALLGGFELAAGGAAAGVDFAAAAERGRGVGGQVAGHPGQVVLAGAAEAHRPRQRRGGRLGQVAEEGQPSLLGRVLVVELLDLVAAPVDVRTQLRGLSAQRIGPVTAVHLDVQQGQAVAAGGDADRGRVHAAGQPADHDRPQSGCHAGQAAALDPGAVPEDGHRYDRRVNAGILRHSRVPPVAEIPMMPQPAG